MNKCWLRFDSPILLLAATLLVAFRAQSAGAQTRPLPLSVSVPAAYCKQSTLTGPAFLNLLNTIIKHGDLTDIAFLQKTLGTKLSLNPEYGADGKPDPDNLDYNSDEVEGNPIHVAVRVRKGERVHEMGGEIALVQFVPASPSIIEPSFFVNCLKLTGADFVSAFGRQGFFFVPTGPLGAGFGKKRLNMPGKNDANLYVWFDYYPSSESLIPMPTSQEAVVNLVWLTQSQ